MLLLLLIGIGFGGYSYYEEQELVKEKLMMEDINKRYLKYYKTYKINLTMRDSYRHLISKDGVDFSYLIVTKPFDVKIKDKTFKFKVDDTLISYTDNYMKKKNKYSIYSTKANHKLEDSYYIDKNNKNVIDLYEYKDTFKTMIDRNIINSNTENIFSMMNPNKVSDARAQFHYASEDARKNLKNSFIDPLVFKLETGKVKYFKPKEGSWESVKETFKGSSFIVKIIMIGTAILFFFGFIANLLGSGSSSSGGSTTNTSSPTSNNTNTKKNDIIKDDIPKDGSDRSEVVGIVTIKWEEGFSVKDRKKDIINHYGEFRCNVAAGRTTLTDNDLENLRVKIKDFYAKEKGVIKSTSVIFEKSQK